MRSHSDGVRSDVYRIPMLIGESESLYNCKMHDLSSFSQRYHFLNRLLESGSKTMTRTMSVIFFLSKLTLIPLPFSNEVKPGLLSASAKARNCRNVSSSFLDRRAPSTCEICPQGVSTAFVLT